MGFSLILQDRGVEAPRNGAQSTLAILGVCSLAAAAVPLSFSRDTSVAPVCGDGPLTELGGYVLRTARVPQVLVPINPSVAGTKSSVSQTGSGPLVTLTGNPFDSLRFKIAIVLGGALGAATFRVAVDGATLGPTLDVPAQTAAGIQGTIDLTTISPISSLNTKTFIATANTGGAITTTFSGVATVADVISQINTALGVNGSALLISGRYLKVVSDTLGPTSTLSIGAGTANGDLGFTASDTSTGLASTYLIPHTGITVTFPSGTYVAGTTYTWTTTEPRFTTTDMAAALTALRNSGLDFEEVVLASQPIDGADTLVLGTSLNSTVTGWQGSAPRKFVPWMMGTPLSATPGSASSDQTNDNDVKTALAGFSSQIGAIAHGDVYLPGTELPGLFRRPAVWALAARAAAYRLSSDPGNGEQPVLESASMVGPDLAKARDEDTALVPMKPQRFTVLHPNRGGADFVHGVTRAASDSKFRHLGIQRMALLAARTALVAMLPYENADRDATPEGKLVPAEADAIEQAIATKLESALIDSPIPGQGHASAVVVTVDRDEKVTETNNLTVTFTVQHKATFETVTGIVGIVSTFTLEP